MTEIAERAVEVQREGERMMKEAEDTKQVGTEIEQAAAQRAKDRALAARWDINIAVFLFAVLILVIILITYTKMGIEVVAPIAIFGLAMVWFVGWRRGKKLYQRFYHEELAATKQALKKTTEETVDETIDEKVQRALRERQR